MSVVFLTGATGFIGKELTKQLVQNGHTVLALVRSPDKWKSLLTNLTPDEQKSCLALAGDMRKERLGLSSSEYEQALGADVIIHAGVPMNISLEESVAREVILEGTTHLIALAKEIHQKNGLEKLIHIVGYMSPFDDESGKLSTDVFAPTDLFKNAGGYEKYKFLSDLLLRQVAFQEGLPLIVVNPSTVVGPRHTGSTEQTDGLGLIVNALRQGKLPVLPWGREWWLPLLSVDDLAMMIVGIVDAEHRDHQTYYALNGRESTLSFPELIQLMAKELRMKPPTTRVPLTLLKKILHWGGSRLLGVPANSMDFIIKKELPLLPFQKIKQQKGIGEYEVAAFIPNVVADLDYRLSSKGTHVPLPFQRERAGKMAGYKKAGSGNPWVILHGLFSDMSDLVPLAEHLKEEAVWLFDLPGFGRSPYHYQENVMEGHIQSAVEAIRELPHPIHLVGHSFGGYLACEIAKRAPEKIEKLYLLQPPPHAPKYPAFLKRPALLRKMLQMNVTTRRLESLLLEQGVFQTKEEIPPNYLEKVGGLLQSPRIMKSHMDVLAYFMGDFTNISDHLPTGIPAHVIWGTRDKVYHLSREAENAFTQSNGKVELLDLGHHFPISHPKLTAEALTSLRNRQ